MGSAGVPPLHVIFESSLGRHLERPSETFAGPFSPRRRPWAEAIRG